MPRGTIGGVTITDGVMQTENAVPAASLQGNGLDVNSVNLSASQTIGTGQACIMFGSLGVSAGTLTVTSTGKLVINGTTAQGGLIL